MRRDSDDQGAVSDRDQRVSDTWQPDCPSRSEVLAMLVINAGKIRFP